MTKVTNTSEGSLKFGIGKQQDDVSEIPMKTDQDNLPIKVNSDSESTTLKKKKRKKNINPGRLSGSIPFEIHTADAQFVFLGYSTSDGVSLLQFGGQMTKIWDAAEQDDPYADWYLLKIYDSIVKCRHQLATVIQDCQEQIRQAYSRTHLRVTPFFSEKPAVQSLWFRTQYGYLGASIIADFDELMRTVLTAHRVGVLLGQSHEAIRDDWVNKIANLFKLPFQWKALDITRKEFEVNRELAEKAQALMGKLPDQVRSKTLRSPFAPTIKVACQGEQGIVNTDKSVNIGE